MFLIVLLNNNFNIDGKPIILIYNLKRGMFYG